MDFNMEGITQHSKVGQLLGSDATLKNDGVI